MADKNTTFPEHTELSILIEALLFVAPSTVSVSQLAEALETTPREVEKGLSVLQDGYSARGIRLQKHRGQFQLTTSPETAAIVERFLSLEATTRLTSAALETLAIIAYQQPATRPQVDAIRGVNSDSVLRNLLSKGLIDETGRSEGPGRPILYATTPEFLQHFGIQSLKELPQLSTEEIEEKLNDNPVEGSSSDNVLKD